MKLSSLIHSHQVRPYTNSIKASRFESLFNEIGITYRPNITLAETNKYSLSLISLLIHQGLGGTL